MRTRSYRKLPRGKKVTSPPSSSTRQNSRPASRHSSASHLKTSAWTRHCSSVSSTMTAWRNRGGRSRTRFASTRSERTGISWTTPSSRMRTSTSRSRCLNSSRARWSSRVWNWFQKKLLLTCEMLTFHKFGWKIMKMMIKNILLDLSKIFQSHQGRLFTVLRDHLNYWYIWMNL